MPEPASRPGAKGHRFGPDLSCSGCGVTWENHQADPQKCVDVEREDALTVDKEFEVPPPLEPKGVGMAAAAPPGIQARAVGND